MIKFSKSCKGNNDSAKNTFDSATLMKLCRSDPFILVSKALSSFHLLCLNKYCSTIQANK